MTTMAYCFRAGVLRVKRAGAVRKSGWNEADHPRGQPGNAGQFGSGGGGGEKLNKLRQTIQSQTHKLSDVVSGKHPVGVEGRGGKDEKEAKDRGMFVAKVRGVTLFARDQEAAQPLINYLENGGKYGTSEFSRLLGYDDKEIEQYEDFLRASGKEELVGHDSKSRQENTSSDPKRSDDMDPDIGGREPFRRGVQARGIGRSGRGENGIAGKSNTNKVDGKLKDFRESDHPRAQDGKFGSGGTSAKPAAKPTSKPTTKPQPPKGIDTPEQLHQHADTQAKGFLSKLAGKITGAAAKVLGKVKDGLKKQFAFLERRYGRKGAVAIFAGGCALGLATPLVIVPGSTAIGAVPFAAIAEVYMQARKLFGKDEQPLNMEKIWELAGELIEQAKGMMGEEKSESMNTAVGSEGGFLVKPEHKSATWDESQHPRDGGKFASKPGAGAAGDKPESTPDAKPGGGAGDADKPDAKPSHADHFGDGWKLEERNGKPMLTDPSGNTHLPYNAGFAPGIADATTAYIAGHADDLISDMESHLEDEDDESADGAIDDFNERLDEGLTTFREMVEAAMEDANDDDRKDLADAVEEYRTYISDKADDLRGGDADDVESNGKYLREGLKAAADDLKTAIKHIYEQQAERAEDADREEQSVIGDRMDDLDSTSEEDGQDIAAEINADMEKEGNRYRVAWDEDEESWVYADAEDLETWPGKVEKRFVLKKSEPLDDDAIELIADILGGIFGDDALKFFDQGPDEDKKKAWSEADHPRGPNGRFIPRGSPEAVAAAKVKIKETLRGGKRTPETHKTLVEHLAILTTKQLHELKKEYNLSASAGIRQQLIEKLADRLGRGRTEKPKIQREHSKTVFNEVLRLGGINVDALAGRYNVKQEFLEHGLGGVFRRGRGIGMGLDQAAEQLEAAGHIQIPENRNGDDYLLELLQNRAVSLHASYDDQLKKEEAAYYKELEDARKHSSPEEVAAVVRAGEESGRAEGEESEVGEDFGSVADEEGAGEDIGDFEFGANVAPEKPIQEKPKPRRTAGAKLEIKPHVVPPGGNQLTKEQWAALHGPDMNLIEGNIAGLPITTTDRDIIGKISKKTRDMLEEAFSDPAIVEAVKDAGISHLRLTPHKGPNKSPNWTMGHSQNGLLFHTMTGNKIESSTVPERKQGGIKRIIHHEAGHGIWDKASEESRKAFTDVLAKHPEVIQEIAKIVNIKPPRDAWNYDEKERAASEVHAELNAMRHYDPKRYNGMPEKLREISDLILSQNRRLPEHLTQRRAVADGGTKIFAAFQKSYNAVRQFVN